MTTATTATATFSTLEDEVLQSLIDSEKKHLGSDPKKTTSKKETKPKKVWKELKEIDGKKSFFKTFKVMKDIPDFLFSVFKISDWPEGIQSFIPPKNTEYVPQYAELYRLLLSWEMKENVLIFGPTGAGKTTMIEYACGETIRPFARCLGREDLESGPIWGQLSVEDEGTKWNDGILTEAAKAGAVILWDEPFVCPPGIQIGAHSLLEDNPTLLLTDKPGTLSEKLVEPDPRMRIVYADNTGGLGDDMGSFAGVQVQNTATLDRFQTVIQLNYLSAEHETKILESKVENIDTLEKDFINKLIKFASLVRNNYVDGELSLTMSPRSLISVARKCVFYEGNIKEAFDHGYLRKFSDIEEKATIEGHIRTVFGVA